MKKIYLDKKVVLYKQFRNKLSAANIELTPEHLKCFNDVADVLVTFPFNDMIIDAELHFMNFCFTYKNIKVNAKYTLDDMKTPIRGLITLIKDNQAILTSFMELSEFQIVYQNLIKE